MKASSLSLLEKRTQFGKPRFFFNRFPCTDVEFAIEREKKEKRNAFSAGVSVESSMFCAAIVGFLWV